MATISNELVFEVSIVHRFSPLLVAFLFAATPLSGQQPNDESGTSSSSPVVRAVRAGAPIQLDGRLNDDAWSAAPVVSGFTQMDPSEGAPGSERTEVRILYDDQALYIGVHLHDRAPATIRLGPRDMPLGDSDWFSVNLDSYHDRRTAFVVEANPAGVKRDYVRTTGSNGSEVDDLTWDAVWEVATFVDSLGWTAEYRIPFAQLRFSSEREQSWGIQMARTIGRTNEYAVLAFTPKRELGGIARYGSLEGLVGILPGKRLEVLPYVVARGEYVDPGSNPFRSSAERSASAGVDVKYRATSNLTLNSTFNPDFGQVEVDPAVVNLGVYETRFEEKRPFFVEGSEIFKFAAGGGGDLFYTRRIGRAPQLSVPTAQSDIPSLTTILGAAKLSGKTARGWSLGILEAVTAREEATYRDAGGTDRTAVVEPLSNYLTARARRELRGGQSAFGGLITAVNRDLATPTLRQQLRSAAYAGAIDFRHEWARRSWVLQGSLSASSVLGDRTAITGVQMLSNHYFQRPDAGHLRVDSTATSLSGISTQLSLGKQAGEHWRGEVTVGTITPGFEVNDLGYSYRTDRRDAQFTGNYFENRVGKFWRNWNIGWRARMERNYSNQLISNWMTVNGRFRHLDYWTIAFSANHSVRANDDRLTRGGPMAVRPAYSNGNVSFISDARKPVTLEASVAGNRDEFGGWQWETSEKLGLKASPRWRAAVGPRFLRQRTVAQYIATIADAGAASTFGRRYIFAELDQTELSLEVRFDFTFTPDLSLQTYLQPLLSSGDYGTPKELLAPRSFEFRDYQGAAPNRDFNLRSLRGNAVLRWEWRPGSTLYLAWQQSRRDNLAGVGTFDFGRDRAALFGARPDNIFVLKVSYWLNP